MFATCDAIAARAGDRKSRVLDGSGSDQFAFDPSPAYWAPGRAKNGPPTLAGTGVARAVRELWSIPYPPAETVRAENEQAIPFGDPAGANVAT